MSSFFLFFICLFFFSFFFFFSSRRRHTRLTCDWSSDVCSSDLLFAPLGIAPSVAPRFLDAASPCHTTPRGRSRTSPASQKETADDRQAQGNANSSSFEHLAERAR